MFRNKVVITFFSVLLFICGLFLLYRKHLVSYTIKRSAGCALRRTMKMSQATAAGARMCEAHSLFYITGKSSGILLY